jgi:hypothetical protein
LRTGGSNVDPAAGSVLKIIFPDRRKNLDNQTIFQNFDSVFDMTGDVPSVSRFGIEGFSGDGEVHLSGNKITGLLMRVGMNGNLTPFFQSEFGQMSFLPVSQRLEANSIQSFPVRSAVFFIKHDFLLKRTQNNIFLLQS